MIIGKTIMIILAVFLPPIAVFLQVGVGKHFWINIILTLIGIVPGMVHALVLTLTNSKILKIVLAVILPPLSVFLHVGINKHFWISIILTLIGVVPGMIYAILLIFTKRR